MIFFGYHHNREQIEKQVTSLRERGISIELDTHVRFRFKRIDTSITIEEFIKDYTDPTTQVCSIEMIPELFPIIYTILLDIRNNYCELY